MNIRVEIKKSARKHNNKTFPVLRQLLAFDESTNVSFLCDMFVFSVTPSRVSAFLQIIANLKFTEVSQRDPCMLRKHVRSELQRQSEPCFLLCCCFCDAVDRQVNQDAWFKLFPPLGYIVKDRKVL